MIRACALAAALLASACAVPVADAAFSGAASSGSGHATAAAVFRPVATVEPSLSGAPSEGETLTASPGTWARQPASLAFRWERCSAEGTTCTPLPATTSTYALTGADVDHRLRVVVTASNAGGTAPSRSQPTARIGGRRAVAPPAASTPPAVSGTPRVDHVLTAHPGTWDPPPEHLALQWLRCTGSACTAISKATASSYALTPADAGTTVRVRVTARVGGPTGPSTTATSVATPVVARSYAGEVLADRPSTFLRFRSGARAAVGPGLTVSGTQTRLDAAGAISTDPTADRAFSVRCCTSYGGLDDASFRRAQSAELWFRTRSGGVLLGQQSAPPFGEAISYANMLYVGTDGRLRVGWWDGTGVRSVTSPATVTDGAWHHAVATRVDGRLVLHLDGARAGSATTSGTWEAITGWSLLGTGSTNGCCWPAVPAGAGYFGFTGDIDEVALYPTALSDQRVRAHRLAGRP